jgi:hypothetical protein
LIHGGKISSGVAPTFSVVGLYWISWNIGVSNTTLPGVAAMFSPTLKACSSVWVNCPGADPPADG